MSIDARITGVQKLPSGEFRLVLEKRDQRTPAGQSLLTVLNPPDPPEQLQQLIGCEIWGSDRCLMLGDEHIADRECYTEIRLFDEWMEMAKDWHEGHPPF